MARVLGGEERDRPYGDGRICAAIVRAQRSVIPAIISFLTINLLFPFSVSGKSIQVFIDAGLENLPVRRISALLGYLLR